MLVFVMTVYKKNLVSNNSCVLAQYATPVLGLLGFCFFLVFFLIIIIVVTQDKNLLNQAAIINGFHYKVLNCRMSVFILYLNQNGNEE